MIWLLLMAPQPFDFAVYEFERGYVEVWYQMPISCVVDTLDFRIADDTIAGTCTYQLRIHKEDGTDSANVEGKKTASVTKEEQGDFIVDYLPVQLYPGRFLFTFDIYVQTGDFHTEGVIEIPPDTGFLICSDVVLGRGGFSQFLFHGFPMIPSIGAEFGVHDHLLAYLELYDLVPDSLYYLAQYRIRDQADAILLSEKKKVLKFDYAQIDTHVIDLSKLIPGSYRYSVDIVDSSSSVSVTRSIAFTITADEDTAHRELYYDIQYLVSSGEYEKFRRLSESQQEIYLKEFWHRHDYRLFTRRIAEADEKFSAGSVLGRDSERGRLYVLLGPPDEIENVPIETWARPFEVWHYYGKNDFLFCDIKNDQNLRLIKVLKPGELTRILASGMREGTRDEAWLSDIAPGTYDWYEDKENPE
jgi:GWxTD domain-containing protein